MKTGNVLCATFTKLFLIFVRRFPMLFYLNVFTSVHTGMAH